MSLWGFNPRLTPYVLVNQYFCEKDIMMKIKGIYRYLLLFCIAFLTGAAAISQTMIQPEPSQELEEAAREQAEMWDEELSLTAEQLALMEDKIIEFAMKKDQVLQSDIGEEEKSQQLIELQESENRDMRDILTKPQYDRYLMLQKQKMRQQNTEN